MSRHQTLKRTLRNPRRRAKLARKTTNAQATRYAAGESRERAYTETQVRGIPATELSVRRSMLGALLRGGSKDA
jgi:hypothetical protein